MFKRATLALLMLGTLAVGSLGITSTSEAQVLRNRYWGRPMYYNNYYVPPTYNYYYAPPYSSWYGVPRTYYYSDPPYGIAPYYTARPGVQVYFR